ncbi:MAG: hypothetical protein GX606_04245 [Elusimicrobia bacterium]|nr:hypothetical protein [Elusimicrobiota bacterium]
MKVLSLKLRDDVFKETEAMVKMLKCPRNAYINDALRFYNKANDRKALRVKLQRASRAVASSSMEFLGEMGELYDAPRDK